jgi:hypothetical protein
MANEQTLRRTAHNVARGVKTKKCGGADGLVVQNLHRQNAIHFAKHITRKA